MRLKELKKVEQLEYCLAKWWESPMETKRAEMMVRLWVDYLVDLKANLLVDM